MGIQIDRLEHDFAAIGRITATPGNGATRPTFTREWGEACRYVMAAAERAGCVVWVDSFGNVHAKPAALPKAARTWLCGSHLDTVPHGGDYDGVAGVLVALELLRSAHDEGVVVPLELIIFAEEEGPTFGIGMIGARLWVGELDEAKLAGFKNAAGHTFTEAGREYGVNPAQWNAERFDASKYLGLIEVHIEQGPGMWAREERLAVVRAIAGRRQYAVTVLGEANHAGSTSMADRVDALAGAAQMLASLERAVVSLSPEAVLTVGRMTVSPGAINVVPDKVEFTIDFRAPEDELLAAGDMMIKAALGGVLERRQRLKCRFAQTEAIPARPMAPALVEALGGGRGLPTAVSGALHDSAVLAPLLPTVMLFVASKGGISHNPAEFSRVEDVAAAAGIVEKLVRRPLLSQVNAMSPEAYVALCGGFFEHSPSVATRAAYRRPFKSVAELAEVSGRLVREATADEQLALIRAHPDLVGRLAREGKLTRESTTEQKAAGLDALTDDEVALFDKYNAAYKEKFGFPFIICARQNRKDAILAAFPVRLGNDRDAEIATALGEIDKIALLRARDAIWED